MLLFFTNFRKENLLKGVSFYSIAFFIFYLRTVFRTAIHLILTIIKYIRHISFDRAVVNHVILVMKYILYTYVYNVYKL